MKFYHMRVWKNSVTIIQIMYGQDEITFNIGDNFKNLYKSYLDELDSYIKTLEEFNK